MNKTVFFSGVSLIVLYAFLASFADAATRFVSQSYAAPQLFFFSGLVGMAASYISNRMGRSQGRMIPRAPRLLFLRSVLFVSSCVFYFYAFRTLVFVEVFAFVALVPVIASLLSASVLNEPVRAANWVAVLLGVVGMLTMYPEGLTSLSQGHVSAFLGAMAGAGSMVLARLISRYEDNALLQVFYPNLAMTLVMGAWLPFVYQPIGIDTMIVVLGYGGLLFAARWVLVLALTRLPAYVATPMINIQFVFMLGIGVVIFAEIPTLQIMMGAVLVIAGSCMLILNHITASGLELRKV